MPDMTLMSLAAAVAPHEAKSLNIASMFLREEKIWYKMVYYTLHST